ncbi:MAG: hypothetical protein AAF388_04095, partial [Bacteroidota bacterium]
ISIDTLDITSEEDYDIIIALDISESMLVEDFKPNRLGAIQRSLLEFFDKNKSNVGFVFFAGETVKGRLGDIDSLRSLNLRRGTAIGSAIIKSIGLLEETRGTQT